MARLEFRTSSRVDVPVEVYDRSLELVGRTLSSRSLSLDAGFYFVVGRLPGGERVRASVDLEADAVESVELAAPSPSRRLPEGRARGAGKRAVSESRRSSWLGRDDAAPPLDARMTESPQRPRGVPMAELRAYRRSADGWSQTDDRRAVRRSGAIAWHGDGDAVGLWPRDGAPTFALLPRKGVRFYAIEVRRGSDGAPRLKPKLTNASADALLDYLMRGEIGEALVMSTSTALSAERLLYDKASDPVAAAAGAFALLQLGELERLHDWTDNLRRLFGWLPDGLVARAEHLAQVGEHDQALSLLLELPARGLPSLGAGLAYATERLRLYAAIHPSKRPVRRALDWIVPYSAAVDVQAKVTTFTGDAPDTPTVTPRYSGQ